MLPLLLAGLLTAGAATPGWSDRRVPSEAPAPPAEPTAGPNHVEVFKDPDGFKLLIDGEPTFVAGMNWGYVPIGENYSYDFWGKSDTFIIEALHSEMTLLRRMGVNSVRQYPVIPPRWVTWIYENYGITSMINPLVGRYGLTTASGYVPNTDYSNADHRKIITEQTMAAVQTYKDVPGVLLFLLGNENNYGLHWTGFEAEDLPEHGTPDDGRAVALYSLYGELIDAIHEVDTHHPVAIANGDLQYLDILAAEAPNVDIMGSNVYRGRSSRDLFDRVSETLDVPFLYTEFGADAYNARDMREDDVAQAVYLHSQWQEIYEHSHGKGRAGNAIGGYTFQWSDGWWKYLQETNLQVHDTNASWPNAGYGHDFVQGQNNMNEEWFGICAKGATQPDGHFRLIPRTAYYVLQKAYELDPYEADIDSIRAHFEAIRPDDFSYRYASVGTTERVSVLEKVTVANVRTDLGLYFTDRATNAVNGGRPRVDSLQSFYVDLAIRPTPQFSAEVSFNVLGQVPNEVIDDIFYENRGRPFEVTDTEGATRTVFPERIKVYGASFKWNHNLFDLEGFYRRGHYHWGYEGDFFGFYPEANYGPNIDIYNGEAPFGFEFTGKKALTGLKVAFGPQLFWGANPSIIAKYRRSFGPVTMTLMHSEDLATLANTQSTFAVFEQLSRRSSLHMEYTKGAVTAELGGIAAGSPRIGQSYVEIDRGPEPTYANSGVYVIDNKIDFKDTLGLKGRVTVKKDWFGGYVEGAYQGLVADGGVQGGTRLTGFSLAPAGRGNHYHAAGGMTFTAGPVQIAPAALFQKPLEGPAPIIADQLDPVTGLYLNGTRARNVQDDPFAVIENRETIGLELLLSYDPTPATWMWTWDALATEDAPFSGFIDFVYRFQPTSRDARFGFNEDNILFAFDGAPAAQNVWHLRGHSIIVPSASTRLVTDAYVGTVQARGIDERLVFRYGGSLSLWYRRFVAEAGVKVDDYGPFDFHWDYNLTFPLQLNADLSYGLTLPRLLGTRTRIGLSGKLRYLNEYSPNILTATTLNNGLGREYEVKTYVQISL